MTLTGNILITGGGTLSNAIVRTAQAEQWDAQFTIYSRSELRQSIMRQKYPHCRYILGDIRDYDRLAAAVAGHSVVLHTAAQKRIPECEAQPEECYATNVQGSANVIRACIAGGVEQCVGVSTDKACRSITTYGASKLMMEGLFCAAPFKPCFFTLVRYGNVVASNGSVIPIWRKQAAEGKPLTITDRRCTRFWMAESDAVRLIVDATTTYRPGAVLVPKMGALPIEEMARIVAPGCDTVEIGLRSCEKIHEDLVHPDEMAYDFGERFLVGRNLLMRNGDDELNHSYTSDTAPRLSSAAFLSMLAEAEAHE